MSNAPKLSSEQVQTLIGRFADATRAIAWAEAGGDQADEEDIVERDAAEAELLQLLTKLPG